MSSTDWGILIPAIVGVLGAAAAWLRAQSAKSSAEVAHARIDAIAKQMPPKP